MIEREFQNGVVTYDREANAVYVSVIGSNAIVDRAVMLVEDRVNMDIDRDGNLVGVEVLL